MRLFAGNLRYTTAHTGPILKRTNHIRQASHRSAGLQTTSASTFSGRFRYLLVAMPITAFALGTWQVQRRKWKIALIEENSEKLAKDPLKSVKEIIDIVGASQDAGDALPVQVSGSFDHQYEMLIGPRQRNGHTGYHVVTPFNSADGIRILVNRGWISKQRSDQALRPEGVKNETVSIFGLIRRTTSRNMFTPANDYNNHQYYFLDIEEMSLQTKSQPILMELTSDSSYSTDDWEEAGIPIGKPHEITLRNNHMQYIVTWQVGWSK